MVFADALELICSRTARESNDGAIGMKKAYIYYKGQHCILPISCSVANASELKFEWDDVTIHLYWP